MYILEKIKSKIADDLNAIIGKDMIKPENLVYPPNAQMGDLSLPCFDLAKELKKSPVEAAADLAKAYKTGREIREAKTAGPYLNFTINESYLAENVIGEILKLKDKFGSNKIGNSQKVMIEYSNANTHKEYHVGHLRNISYGDAVNRITQANGWLAIPVSYINDFGIHVAKTLWLLKKNYIDEKQGISLGVYENVKGYFLGSCYVQSTKELENNDEGKKEVGVIMKAIESRQGDTYELWEKTRQWSIDQFAQIYKELGVHFDHIFYENEFIAEGLSMVADLEKKGFLRKSEGALIADLEPYGLGVLLFLRSDGTALYPVADLPLAMAKFKKYGLDKSIYVVDIRQSLYFKQLAKVLELLGYNKEIVHLGYDFVKLPSGMMSSRTGNVITYEDLKQQMMTKTTEETKKRHEDWSAEKIQEVAWKIAVGAIKFEMIKVGPSSVITFDINEALRFDGFTAAYLQYTYARINSILRKAEELGKGVEADLGKLKQPQEKNLVLKMAKFPGIVAKAGETYSPAEIAKYLFELGKEFNEYYHSIPVLKAEEGERNARLELLRAVNTVIARGLALLGIATVDEM